MNRALTDLLEGVIDDVHEVYGLGTLEERVEFLQRLHDGVLKMLDSQVDILKARAVTAHLLNRKPNL